MKQPTSKEQNQVLDLFQTIQGLLDIGIFPGPVSSEVTFVQNRVSAIVKQIEANIEQEATKPAKGKAVGSNKRSKSPRGVRGKKG